MARFPTTEAEIVALARSINTGLKNHSKAFPMAQMALEELPNQLTHLLATQQTVIAARVALQGALEAKNEALHDLINTMRRVLRYAETDSNYDDAQLKLLGWGGRANRIALQPPGQCRALEALRQGRDWLFLDWKKPIDGGAVAGYKIQRREQSSSMWQDVLTALTSEARLVDQERGKDLEYRVVAINKAGEGAPSNSVAVVL